MDNVIQNINIEDIVPNSYQHQYSTKEIEDLTSSIKKHGLLEPITLRKKNNKYELILGNKRYKACKKAGLKQIPAIIKKIDDEKAKEYFMINNDNLVLNNIPNSDSKDNNLDVVNLSKLNQEYERDEIIMNNNQFNGNIQQPMNNSQNEPTFGGRFFPSLEDEPTNMNFGTNPMQTPPAPMPNSMEINNQPQNNNFIDLTDLNIGNQANQMPQNNFVDMQPNFNQAQTMEPQQDIAPQPMMQNNYNQPIETNPTMNIDSGNIINLESLKQNPEMGTQPIPGITNIDNNFQEIMNDFGSSNDMNAPFSQPTMPENNSFNTNFDMSSIQPQNYNLNENNIPSPLEPQMNNNMDFMQNNAMSTTMQEPISLDPIMENSNMMNNYNSNITPDFSQQTTVSQKDVMPVINTLKALSINLENFGYTIRITDEDLPSSYKITIEVDK